MFEQKEKEKATCEEHVGEHGAPERQHAGGEQHVSAPNPYKLNQTELNQHAGGEQHLSAANH